MGVDQVMTGDHSDQPDQPDQPGPSGPSGQEDKILGGWDLVGLGGMLVGAVVAGLILGLVIDDLAGTSPVFSLVGIFLGIVAGGVAFWLRVRSVLK